MSGFHYEWWTVSVREPAGWVTWEVKGKTRNHVIRQIKKAVVDGNSEENRSRPFWERKPEILEVDWATLQLDRVGYQRLS